MVMCTTSTITAILGYPRDMWNGRSFIDFVHPKDRLTFTNTITSGVTLPFGDQIRVGDLQEVTIASAKWFYLSISYHMSIGDPQYYDFIQQIRP